MRFILRKFAPIFIVAVLGAVIGGGLVLGYGPFFLGKSLPEAVSQLNKEVEQPKTANAALSAARNTPIVRAAQIVGPSVVGITNKAYVNDMFNRRTLVERGSGSGVIFDASGHIITNWWPRPRKSWYRCRTGGRFPDGCRGSTPRPTWLS